MSIVYDEELENEIRYSISFNGHIIITTVTADPLSVSNWISNIRQIHRHRLHYLIVGLDVEWRPNFSRGYSNPVALLQLCVGCHCLVFQIIHAPYIPDSLKSFLTDPNFRFVGVAINSDVERLMDDYALNVACMEDLRRVAAIVLDMNELNQAGLKGLARQVLGVEMQKPNRVTMSRWDSEWLNWDQVIYAAIDAYLSFEIGKVLLS